MFTGLKNLGSSKKATLTVLIGAGVGMLMQQGLITDILGAQLLTSLGIGYSVGQGIADRGGNGGTATRSTPPQ